MRNVVRFAAFAIIGLIDLLSASAHPGHGHSGPEHYFTEPVHLIAALMIVVAAVVTASCTMLVIRRGIRSTDRR